MLFLSCFVLSRGDGNQLSELLKRCERVRLSVEIDHKIAIGEPCSKIEACEWDGESCRQMPPRTNTPRSGIHKVVRYCRDQRCRKNHFSQATSRRYQQPGRHILPPAEYAVGASFSSIGHADEMKRQRACGGCISEFKHIR